MPRPSFSVVAGTLVVLVGFGVIRRYLTPFIPPAYVAVSPETSDYLRSGETQSIRWRPLSVELVTEARRKDQPILLLLGSESSRIARDLDDRAFNDAEVVRYVADNFLPARVDLTVSPAWRGVLGPIARTGNYHDEGLQIAILTAEGRPVLVATPTSLDASFDRDTILGLLDNARERLRSAPSRYPAEAVNRTELAVLESKPGYLPSPDAGLSLRTRTDRSSGLVMVPGGAILSPWSLDTIARAGEVLFARDALQALASSSMTDPLEGGVFLSMSGAPDSTARRIECTKGLLLNAALAETAARIAAATGDPAVDRFARQTADWCLRTLERGAPAFVVSDQGLDTISPFYSLTLRRLRALSLKSEIGVFRAGLGADSDPQALGRLTAPPVTSIRADLDFIAKSGTRPPEANRGIVAIEASVMARLLGAARLSGDADRARTLGERLDQLDLRVERNGGDLSLFLALADVHFADFLANGRAQGLDLAKRDLSLALSRYATSDGSIRAGDVLPDFKFVPNVPDLADGTREASAAVALRLADAIGRTLERGPEAERLLRWARSCARRYAPVLGTDADHPNGTAAPESAAFLGACAEVADPQWRVAAGQDPVRSATDELRRHPFSLVIPAIGAAAPSVPRSSTGILLRKMPPVATP